MKAVRKAAIAVLAASLLFAAIAFGGCAIMNPAELFSRLGDNTYVEEHDITRIEIYRAPDKTDYMLGDKFSSEGMILKVYYDDGFYSYENEFECSLSEGTVLTTENNEFTATFGRWSVTQELDVALPEDLFSVLDEGYSTIRMEAENAVMTLPEGNNILIGTEGRTLEETNYPSGDKFVARLSYAENKGAKFAFEFEADTEGWCVLSAGMGSVGGSGADRGFDDCLAVTANGTNVSVTLDPIYTNLDWQDSGGLYTETGFYNWTCRPITIFRITKGKNVVELTKPSDSNIGLNFDYIELSANGSLTALS